MRNPFISMDISPYPSTPRPPARGGAIAAHFDYNPRPRMSRPHQESMVNQPELELQLKVWKELAISKQMLMRAATDALKLDPNCSQEELKAALEGVLKKIAKAETETADARAQAKTTITAMENKVAASERALATAQASVAQLQAAQETARGKWLPTVPPPPRNCRRSRIACAEQEKALKAINTALSDTPENVIKKMNVLKKQKQEEADMRRQIEILAEHAANREEAAGPEGCRRREAGRPVPRAARDQPEAARARQGRPAGAKDLPAVPELDAKLLEEPRSEAVAEEGKTASQGTSNGAKSKAEAGEVEEVAIARPLLALPRMRGRLRTGRNSATAAPPPRRTPADLRVRLIQRADRLRRFAQVDRPITAERPGGHAISTSFAAPLAPLPVLSPAFQSAGSPARSRRVPVVDCRSHAINCSRDWGVSTSPSNIFPLNAPLPAAWSCRADRPAGSCSTPTPCDRAA